MKAPVLFDLASKYFNRVFDAVDLVIEREHGVQVTCVPWDREHDVQITCVPCGHVALWCACTGASNPCNVAASQHGACVQHVADELVNSVPVLGPG